MVVVASSGSEPEKKPDTQTEDPQSLTDKSLPKRKASVFPINIGTVNSIDNELLESHARARGQTRDEAARAIFLEAIRKPVVDTIKDEVKKQIPINGEWKDITHGETTRRYFMLTIELSPDKQEYAKMWHGLIKGFTDWYQRLFPIVDGKMPYCDYPSQDQLLKRCLIAAKLFDQNQTQILKNHSLEILSPDQKSEGTKAPTVYAIPLDKLHYRLERSQPMLEAITEQINAAKKKHTASAIRVNVEDPAHPALSEAEIAQIRQLNLFCKTALKIK